ncbi:MAG: MBL fold metallo-hydrolase [Candidatus Parcubacteria bacterium]|nr:MBL fold metallo-hydrolase [Candidatus Parcubacteria bacterium]
MKIRFWKILILILIVLNAFFWLSFFSYLSKFNSSVTYLSVGQGDSELISTFGGHVLIDAGPNASILEPLAKALPFYEKTIDVFVLSNQDKDHYGGLLEILKRYKVRSVMMAGVINFDESFKMVKDEIIKQQIPVFWAAQGAEIYFSDNRKIKFIYPNKGMFSENKSTNDLSVVLDYQTPTGNFLFTGDIGFKIEDMLMSVVSQAKYIALKVAHHGSKYASSSIFLNVINPAYAIIEVGKNSYGHPDPGTISRLEAIGSQIFRTDQNGNIVFSETKNQSWKINQSF